MNNLKRVVMLLVIGWTILTTIRAITLVVELDAVERKLETALVMAQDYNDMGMMYAERLAEEQQLRISYEELAESYLQHADILAAFNIQDYLPPDEILRLTEEIPRGNPFIDKVWFKSASFGESVGLHGAYRSAHTGIDIWSHYPQLQATGLGVVTEVARDEILGLYMKISYGPDIVFTYAHLSKVYYIGDVGKIVNPGQTIALMGNSGMSENAHVHLTIELKVHGEWRFIDPEPFLRKD